MPPRPVTAPGPLAHYPDLRGKVAVVTGGSRGIGAAAAAALAANGASVAVVARDLAVCEQTVESITADRGRAVAIAADCSNDWEVGRMAAEITERIGRPEIVVAFAGGNGAPMPLTEETGPHFREVLDGNLTSTFMTIQAFLPGLLEQGRGSVITMASSAARQAAKSSAAYAAAKAGVIALTRHLAGELGPQNLRFNCVAPSAVENDRMRQWMTDEQRAALGASFLLGRIGQPADVAAATLFLASDASSWITGATLDIAGGKVMV